MPAAWDRPEGQLYLEKEHCEQCHQGEPLSSMLELGLLSCVFPHLADGDLVQEMLSNDSTVLNGSLSSGLGVSHQEGCRRDPWSPSPGEGSAGPCLCPAVPEARPPHLFLTTFLFILSSPQIFIEQLLALGLEVLQ